MNYKDESLFDADMINKYYDWSDNAIEYFGLTENYHNNVLSI